MTYTQQSALAGTTAQLFYSNASQSVGQQLQYNKSRCNNKKQVDILISKNQVLHMYIIPCIIIIKFYSVMIQ